MVLSRNPLLLPGACFLALGALADAQSQSRMKFTRHTQPLRVVSLNLETGSVTRGPRVSERSTMTTIDFDNLDLGGFIGVDSGGGFCEWMDSGAKGGHPSGAVPSDLVSNFIFAYCSAALDPLSGGPGGSMRWTFYPSYTTGGPHPATSSAVGAFTLTGLPAHTTVGSVFTQIACFFMNVTFGNLPLPFPDGQIGYSWTFVDLDAGTGPLGGVFAATFPFLACVSSCAGPGDDGWGMDDLIDQYCPAEIGGATPLTTFSFGTNHGGGWFTSLNIDMRELDVAATATPLADPLGNNTDVLVAAPVVIGGTWTSQVTPDPLRTTGSPLGGLHIATVWTGGGGPLEVDFSSILAAIGFLPPGNDAPPSTLQAGQTLLGVGSVGNWTDATPSSIAIPPNAGFLGLSWTAQNIVFGDFPGLDSAGNPDPGGADGQVDAKLTNAYTGVVGSQ